MTGQDVIIPFAVKFLGMDAKLSRSLIVALFGIRMIAPLLVGLNALAFFDFGDHNHLDHHRMAEAGVLRAIAVVTRQVADSCGDVDSSVCKV